MSKDGEVVAALSRKDWAKVERLLADMSAWERMGLAEMAANERSWSAVLERKESDGNGVGQ